VPICGVELKSLLALLLSSSGFAAKVASFYVVQLVLELKEAVLVLPHEVV
jgi:hypothetical protein